MICTTNGLVFCRKLTELLCISKAVANELAEWLKIFGPEHLRQFKIDWFHLGADIKASAPSRGMPDDAAKVLDTLALGLCFLMVGTVEPRKGIAQALAAFEQLWMQGVAVNLVIVGRQGWMVEALARKIAETSSTR